MKRFLVGLVLSLCALMTLEQPAGATNISAMDCVTMTNFAQLVSAGSCTIGSGATQITFSGFTFTPSATGTGIMPVASQLTYTVDNGVPATPLSTDLLYGFEFNPNLNVINVGSQDIRITYNINAQDAILASLHLFMTGFSTENAVASVIETDVCSPPLTDCNLAAYTFPAPGVFHQDLEKIGPFTTISVTKDMNVTSFAAGGFATLSGVRDAVDLAPAGVPEPTTFSYLAGGAGILALGWIRRKPSKKVTLPQS